MVLQGGSQACPGGACEWVVDGSPSLPGSWDLGVLGAKKGIPQGNENPFLPLGGGWEVGGVLGISLPGERSRNANIRGACEAPAPQNTVRRGWKTK